MYLLTVVPHAGTWIEITAMYQLSQALASFPTRERGLKLKQKDYVLESSGVVPHARTWIEIKVISAIWFL